MKSTRPTKTRRDGKKRQPTANAAPARKKRRPVVPKTGNGLASSLPAASAPDENWRDAELLERARMQWQFGDWESLAQIDDRTLETHTDRAKLALLVASAHQQMNDHGNARRLLHLSRTWGCDRKLIARLLVAGVHNTLGRAAALAREEARALSHFREAVEGVAGDARLACQARSVREVARLGLHRHAGEWIERQLAGIVPAARQSQALLLPSHVLDSALAARAQSLVAKCLAATDVHAAIDAELGSPDMHRNESFAFCLALADAFVGRDDKITAIHFLNTARQYAAEGGAEAALLLSRKMLALGQHAPALDMLVAQAVKHSDLSATESAALDKAYANVRAASLSNGQHGHDLLLGYLRQHADEVKRHAGVRRLLLVEIGSTRENVPGQGSTRLIAEYCKSANVDFVTVDMDPHNTASAATMFQRIGVDFRAINRKGEDFLRDYDEEIDFAFLDAYDFDHGKHSDLRQSRYEKYLGSRIDERQCHQMHLECAESLQRKLSLHGLICIDDTWLEDGKWTAKGTLAVPYLLDNGFEIVEARNRAALLRRRKQSGV